MNASQITSMMPTRVAAALLLAVLSVLPMATAASAQIAPMPGCLSWAGNSGAIVYCGTTPSGGTELFEQDASGRVRQLTYLGGTVAAADVSVDGTKVAFEASLRADVKAQIYVIDRLGPRSRKVLVGPAVIDIGRRIVMVGGTAIEVPTASALKLTDAGSNLHPVFTPDGSQIGFVSDRHGQLGLWSMNIDGSNQHEMLLAAID